MKKPHFEKTRSGPYPAVFHLGAFFVPVEEAILEKLKDSSGATPQAFLQLIERMLASNSYLKRVIQESITQAGDPDTLAKTLREEIKSL